MKIARLIQYGIKPWEGGHDQMPLEIDIWLEPVHLAMVRIAEQNQPKGQQ
jgi:hypothetical protein